MVHLKQINRLLLIGGMSTVPGLTRAQQANDEKPKNILMILVDDAYADGRVARKAIDRLRELKKEPEQPFFMAVGFVRPHLPFSVPKKYWDMYDPGNLPMPQYEKMLKTHPKWRPKGEGRSINSNRFPRDNMYMPIHSPVN